MHHLKHTQKFLTQALRQSIPHYWMDKVFEEAIRRNPALLDKHGVQQRGQVLALLRHPQLELEFSIPGLIFPSRNHLALNLVTNDGDTYYAQMGGGETPTDDFTAGGIRHGSDNTAATKTDTDVTTFLSGTGHAVDATYPQTNDPDGNNTGAGVDILTWRYSYITSEGNASGIYELAIVDDIVTPTAALTHAIYAASFNKTSSDTLVVYVNHEFLGV